MKRILALLLVLMMCLSMFAGCGKEAEDTANPTNEVQQEETVKTEEAQQQGEEKNVLKLQWNQQIGIDTLFESPWTDIQCLLPDMVYESLIVQEPGGGFAGQLASDWTVAVDGLSYTFTIRDGVTWHDGEPFTAEDVVWSWNASIASGSYWASVAGPSIVGYTEVTEGKADSLSGIVADGNEVTFILSEPNRMFLTGICKVKILPKHLLGDVPVAEVNTKESFWSKPVGTGIYMIDQVAFPDYCTLVANPNYYGEKAGIEYVQFVNYAAGGNDAVVAALISGDLSFANGSVVADMEIANNVLSQNSDMTMVLENQGYNRYFAFNVGERADGNVKDDLKNEKVRQAFNLLIDKEAIASFYSGQAVALSTMVSPTNTAAYNSDIPLPEKNTEEARKLLEEADFDFSQTIDVSYYYDDQTTADIMALVKQNFAEAGVTVNTSLMTGDLATLIYTDCNYDLLYLAASSDDPIQLYKDFISNSAYTFLGDDEVRAELFDGLYAQWLAATDDATAKKLGDELQAVGYQSAYMIPCYGLNLVTLYNAKIIDIPEEVFAYDMVTARNWHFEGWSING